jgi:hypothetical protein
VRGEWYDLQVPELAADRYRWTHLNRLQLGKYAEYLAKMEFVLLGCDVFTSEVDDHGIDFVVRTKEGTHYDVQVKSYRPGTTYVYLPRVHPSLLLAVVQFVDGELPALFLVQSCVSGGPNPMFKKCYYTEAGKREFEWGLSLAKKNLALLEKDHAFHAMISNLV